MKNNLLELLHRRQKALSESDLIHFLRLETPEEKEELRKVLAELIVESRVRKTKKQKYTLLSGEGCFVGDIQITDRGFGFFIFEEEENKKDMFIPPNSIGAAMNGDKVLACISKQETKDHSAEGYVERVIEHRTTSVVGRIELGKNAAFVIPSDKRIKSDIYIPKEGWGGALDNQIVEVEITAYPKKNKNPEGRVISILGEKGDPFIDVQMTLQSHGIRTEFPEEVIKQAEAIPKTISKEELQRRKDLRELFTVTIDGADAKDFDDAISIEKTDRGYMLYVSIADVTHYVRENTPIDKEAYLRGTSVYFPGRVVPMLPEALSNHMCSLVPHEDRLTLTAQMEVDTKGKVIEHSIYESVINSNHRLIYDDVSDFLESDRAPSDEKEEALRLMEELGIILKDMRLERGAIDFGFVETEIEVDDKGWPIRIFKRDRRIANRLIEEFMILANETVSEHYYWLEIPFLYRTHEKPSEEKMSEFNKFIHNFGYKLRGSMDDIHPKELNNLIEQLEGKKEANIINRLMLRSLRQARYTAYMEGHFGMASTYYSHFTSPIRRYPDLQIHRIIKEHLHGEMDENRIKHYQAILSQVAKQSSDTERQAEEAEREIEDIKMAEFMADKIGEEFGGTISGVANFGFFVELDNGVEGMVRLSEIKGHWFNFDKENFLLRDEKSSLTLTVGDKVRVKLARVNEEHGEITFEWITDTDE